MGPGKDTHGTPVPAREGCGWPTTRCTVLTNVHNQEDRHHYFQQRTWKRNRAQSSSARIQQRTERRVVLFSRLSRSWVWCCFPLCSLLVLCFSPPPFLLLFASSVSLVGGVVFSLLILLGVGAFFYLLAVVLPLSSKIELSTAHATILCQINRSESEVFFREIVVSFLICFSFTFPAFCWIVDLGSHH